MAGGSSGTPRRLGPGARLLVAVVSGLAVLAVGTVALVAWVLPGNGPADPTRLYDYVYADGKSENADFVLANMSSDGYLCFGSSEFYISKDKVSMCPQSVFGENVTGVDMTYIGEGYDQSLWQAIAAGSYGSRVSNKKVMIVVSPQWFFKGGGDQDKFYTKFSYSLYRAFAQNPDISDETKAYVRQRCGARHAARRGQRRRPLPRRLAAPADQGLEYREPGAEEERRPDGGRAHRGAGLGRPAR